MIDKHCVFFRTFYGIAELRKAIKNQGGSAVLRKAEINKTYPHIALFKTRP
jgi:hypothetical protein